MQVLDNRVQVLDDREIEIIVCSSIITIIIIIIIIVRSRESNYLLKTGKQKLSLPPTFSWNCTLLRVAMKRAGGAWRGGGGARAPSQAPKRAKQENEPRLTSISRACSHLLRHSLEVNMDLAGYAEVSTLLNMPRMRELHATVKDLEEIIRDDAKGRLELVTGAMHYVAGSSSFCVMRATQGHSVAVDLDLTSKRIASRSQLKGEYIAHATTSQLLPTLMEEGIKPMGRAAVHLCQCETLEHHHRFHATATMVVAVDVQAIIDSGDAVYEAANGVVLCPEIIPWEYVSCVRFLENEL